jgi:signal transduction histidine kinase/DNA-binding LacI/PurR family transcriptional regulator/DNA-binding response OmpR family regulator
MKARKHPTIGFLSTWSVYGGTTIDNYTHTLLQGIYSAAHDLECNLLIGCGISRQGDPRGSRTAWAVPGTSVDFIPVGPWNTDGLIIIPDDLSDVQLNYVQDLIQSGYPIILTTAEKPGPLVAVDNDNGIRMAFNHLLQHGHRQIAFIAGKAGRGGDSAERLAAYRAVLQEGGIEEDERLIAYGEHRREDGKIAMKRILDSGAPFTALIASNDLSALGAIEVLRAAGRRIPDDVAVIGFDDILEARSQLPPLTTIRHPTFTLGYQAVLTLLKTIHGGTPNEINTRVATQLVIRQSCGCRTENSQVISLGSSLFSDPETTQAVLAQLMAEATFIEVRHSPRKEIETLCSDLVRTFHESLTEQNPAPFAGKVQHLVEWLEVHDEDGYAWHAALSILRLGFPGIRSWQQVADIGFADALIDQARLTIAELTQRQATDALVKHMMDSNRLGLMTSQLQAALNITEITDILTQHLPQLGIEQAILALYAQQEDDPFSQSRVLLDIGLGKSQEGSNFPTREFPPSGFFTPDSAVQLAILPLVIDVHKTGFVALSATNLEPCAAIVHNLTSALRTNQLYHDAVEGQLLAEESNRLKSRFLSMVSHELRTPLSLIVGLSEMILREQRAQPEVSSAILHDLEQVSTSAQHLARLIGDVLDLASSESGQLRILHEPCDLTEVLQVAAKIGEQMAQEKGLVWQSQLPRQGITILGDRTRLRQITLNLISNAVKFTSNGQISLTVDVIDQKVVVSVSDTGIGVAPEEQDLIFQEFHRAEQAIQTGSSGLGLGLTISKQLVIQHGGYIGCRSPGDLGRGSTFFFELPILPETSQPDQAQSSLNQLGGSLMILTEPGDLVDPLSGYLRQHGFDVEVCQIDTGNEWLKNVIASPPYALILGHRLAEREGWAIIGMLKQQAATEHIPVLACAFDLERDRGELLEMNYLYKPLLPEQLAEQLTRFPPERNEQRTVLVVDDDPAIVDFHSRLVEEANCRAITAQNGREALTLLESTHPDLILLDLMMPEMDGFAVLEALRAKEATRDIPVIILTARVLSNADLERCNRSVATILNKGIFSATETLNHIEAALARQHSLGRPTQKLVRQAMTFIHAHFAEALSREDIASHVGISADYLTDCFRQEMSVTPMIYLRRYRIRQACELLENTDRTITQVAGAVGFSESAHFTHIFQREVGMTPRAYRDGKCKRPTA